MASIQEDYLYKYIATLKEKLTLDGTVSTCISSKGHCASYIAVRRAVRTDILIMEAVASSQKDYLYKYIATPKEKLAQYDTVSTFISNKIHCISYIPLRRAVRTDILIMERVVSFQEGYLYKYIARQKKPALDGTQ